MSIRFGVFVPQGWRRDLSEISDPITQYEAMTAVAKTVDALPAYDSIWVYDHFHTVPTVEREPTFEAWTTTAALARDTERVHVGQMVSCNGYRNPAYFAKIASTVDVLSHGRLYCGLGAGWYEHEWRAYGYGFPETKERMRMFREACEIIVKMWTETAPVYQGTYYTIDQPVNEPRGVRQPHPSFWLGGGGEQVTLKLVAQYANACNINGDVETLRHKFGVLRQHCEAVGRDYDSIIRSHSLNVLLLQPGEDPAAAIEQMRPPLSREEFANWFTVGTADAFCQQIEAKMAVGVDYFILYFPRIAYDHRALHRFADEVIARFV
ncbi:MAG: LLM class F420-dependent oxidoreductase [Chloroflexaceae bacterium]|nr:LLM class F420-dependent oxidoreductase [Chloroflexaceae bacterium]